MQATWKACLATTEMGVNWGGRGVSQTVRFLFDMMVFWYWLCWRQCGSTVVVGLQLEEESLLRAAYLPDHWDDCLFCMTTADNERLDQEPTDCPRTSCIIYSLLHYLCFVFTQTLGLASAGLRYISPHWAEQTSAAVWSRCICRGVGMAEFLHYCTSLNHGFPVRKIE